jgi:hypothetical protein
MPLAGQGVEVAGESCGVLPCQCPPLYKEAVYVAYATLDAANIQAILAECPVSLWPQ